MRSAGANMIIVAGISVATLDTAYSAEINTGSDVKVRWDTTVKYSTGMRVAGSEGAIGDNPGNSYALGGNDGDRAFKKWNLISNRVDLLSGLNVSRNDFGFRVSGAAWYDDIYNRHHASVPSNMYNASSVGIDTFTHAAQVQQGKNAELQDAFVFGKGEIGSTNIRFRAGRHTLLWGESLFLASNGIAYGQAPIDVAKASGVPNTQAKEVFMPVGQLSIQVQPTNNLSFEAYWQPEWRPSRLPAAGSYFSTGDHVGAGAERILAVGYNPSGGFPSNALFFRHSKDIKPTSLTEQFGAAVKYRSDAIDTDFGLYAIVYNDKAPQAYAHVAATTLPDDYKLVYARNVEMYGASASTQVGDWNVGTEVSYRRNTPFISGDRGIIASVPYNADAGSNKRYAVGDSLHAQVSGIYLMGPGLLWQGGTIMGEVGGHRRIATTKNLGQLDRNRSHQAGGARAVFEPQYFQVLPAVDVSIPIGMGYTVGKSPIDMGFNNGAPDRGGDVSIGLKADYEKVWYGSLNYTHYFGRPDQQYMLGHDFVALSVHRTF